MQNHKRKSGRGKAVVAFGLALLTAVAFAELRYVKLYSYVLNNPPGVDFLAKLKRYPQGDSTDANVQPTDGLCRFDTRNLEEGSVSIDDTFSIEIYNRTNPNQKTSVVRVVDTLPYTLRVASSIMHDTTKSGRPFSICGNVDDTLKMPGTLLRVASWLKNGKDTTITNIPPFEGNDHYDSLRIDADGVPEGETIYYRIYNANLEDTTSMYTDSSIVVNRDFGGLENDVAWIRKAMIFPKTVLGIHEIKNPELQHRQRMKSPCKARDLQLFAERNYGKVEVINSAGRTFRLGGYNETPPGAYLLGHAKHEENFIGTQKVVVTK